MEPNSFRKQILDFPQQFSWEPQIINGPLPEAEKYVVAGMGGSHIPADLLKILRLDKRYKPDLNLTIHKNYGLPDIPTPRHPDTLFMACSYSGNTEETIDFYKSTVEKKLLTTVITQGGQLLDLAKTNNTPYIEIPPSDIQPRMAIGYMFIALLKATRQEELLQQAKSLSSTLKPEEIEPKGKELAEKINGHIPIIYSSSHNIGIAQIWKVLFNETAKTPSFFNVFPELNHNEMQGFDWNDQNKPLSEKFYFIFLRSASDDAKIVKRMEITQKLLEEKNLPVEVLQINQDLNSLFSNILLAHCTSLYTALAYSQDPEKVPMIEKLKKALTPSPSKP